MTARLYGECLNCNKVTCIDCPILGELQKIAGNTITEVVRAKQSSVKSDGGSSSYYTFYIDGVHGSDKIKVETENVIRNMVANDFDLGNILKAARRISEAEAGRGKEGTDLIYDWKKIKYTAEKRIALLEGKDKERNK